MRHISPKDAADLDATETREWLDSARLCAAERRARQSRAAAARADALRQAERRQAAVHRQHSLRQHHSRRRAGAHAGQPRHRAPHQEPRPLERRGDGRAREQGAKRASAATSRRLPRPRRCTKSASTISSAATTITATRDVIYLPGPRGARHLRARVPRRPHRRDAPRELPPRAEGRRRPLVVSASVADARLLGLPHRVDGPQPASWRSTRRASSATSRIAG